ncbi:hypothetical protein D3C86_2202360 [compost metagenome]
MGSTPGEAHKKRSTPPNPVSLLRQPLSPITSAMWNTNTMAQNVTVVVSMVKVRRK